jgi:anti-sigma regulatory factor (Ser/Thr protein kinase)
MKQMPSPRAVPDTVGDVSRQELAMAEMTEFIAVNGSCIGTLRSGNFEIRTLSEAKNLATLLACHCPEPERVAPGIWELLSNAIEHGNLAISFDEKTRLLRAGTFLQEVETRARMLPYSTRRVRVEFESKPHQSSIVISDEGSGFDYNAVLRRGPSLDRPNGRGIAIATGLSFDSLNYRGNGNRVEVTLRGRG